MGSRDIIHEEGNSLAEDSHEAVVDKDIQDEASTHTEEEGMLLEDNQLEEDIMVVYLLHLLLDEGTLP